MSNGREERATRAEQMRKDRERAEKRQRNLITVGIVAILVVAAVVATALFGDGAAAAVVTSGLHSLARIRGSAERIWPDTLRIMGWDVHGAG